MRAICSNVIASMHEREKLGNFQNINNNVQRTAVIMESQIPSLYTLLIHEIHLNKGCTIYSVHTHLKCNLVTFEIPKSFP